MATKIGSKALITNLALKSFDILLGEWQTTGSHPYLPNVTLHGRTSFEKLEGGAFLIVRTEIHHPKFPDGIEIFGSDDMTKEFFMLHFDERGISRKYDVKIDGHKLEWRRDDPVFSQRFTLAIEDDGHKLMSWGEMSRDGAPWEKDLELA